MPLAQRAFRYGMLSFGIVLVIGCESQAPLNIDGDVPSFLAGVWSVEDSITATCDPFRHYGPFRSYVDTIQVEDLDFGADDIHRYWGMLFGEGLAVDNCWGLIDENQISITCEGTISTYNDELEAICTVPVVFRTEGILQHDSWTVFRNAVGWRAGAPCGVRPGDTLKVCQGFKSALKRMK